MADSSDPIKDHHVYDALRDEGASKEKAARIANASANQGREQVAAKGGESPSYDDWTKDDLYGRAQELDIAGRSDMTKDELIEALRNH